MTCAEYEKQAQHLTSLALQEAWKAYVWQRLQELDQTPRVGGGKAEVLKRIESFKQQQRNGG